MRIIILLSLLLIPTFSFAQQQSPSEFALQATSMVAQLGQLAEQQKKQIETMQAQISQLKTQLEEVKKNNTPEIKK